MKKVIETIFYAIYWLLWKVEAISSGVSGKSGQGRFSREASSKKDQQPIASGKLVGSLKSKRKKFHDPRCRYALGLSKDDEIWFHTPQEALEAGYEACGFCQDEKE